MTKPNHIFFCSDLHLEHKNILNFEGSNRPFKDLDHHNHGLIQNWNSVVQSEDDQVWCLGDVIFGGSPNYDLIRQLNGRKFLVGGNHDTPKKMRDFFELGLFEKIVGCIEIADFIITHIPVHPSQVEKRFMGNIHGHVHSHTLKDPRYYNVSMENIGCTPISLAKIQSEFKKRGIVKNEK